MREKLEWLKLIIPGLILTGLVVTQVLGAGPDLQEIPDRLLVQNEDTEKVDVPVTSTKPEVENAQKEKKEKKKAEKLSYNGPENGYKDGTYYGSATGYGGTIQVAVTIQNGKLTAVKIVSASDVSGSGTDSGSAVSSATMRELLSLCPASSGISKAEAAAKIRKAVRRRAHNWR